MRSADLLGALRTIRRSAFLRVLVVGIVIGTTTVGAGESAEERLRREGPKAWETYVAFLARLQGSYEIRIIVNGDTKAHWVSELKQNTNCSLNVSQRKVSDAEKEATRGDVQAANLAYAFTLLRETSSAPWVVARVHSATDESFGSTKDEIRTGLRNILSSLTGVRGAAMKSLLERPTFHVVRSEPVQVDGAECIRFTVDNTHQWNEEPFMPLQRGSITLDPKRAWCVRAAEEECQYSTGIEKTRLETRIRDSAGGFPIPISVISEGESQDGNTMRAVRYEYTYALEEPTQLPNDSEFTMTAFGLPEPIAGASAKPTQWWIWVALAGGGMLLLGAGFRWLRGKANG